MNSLLYAHLTFRKRQKVKQSSKFLNACSTKYFKINTCALLCFLFFIHVTSPVNASVVINEVLPDPEGNDKENEWVELYNASGSSISIDGYVLEDNKKRRIVLSGEIKDWFIVYPKSFPKEGSGSFSLTNKGSIEIKLFTSTVSAEPIDTFSYTESSEDKSWGRIPDGQLIYAEKLTPTLGSANQLPPTPTPEPTAEPTAQKTANPTHIPANPTPQKTSKPVVLGKTVVIAAPHQATESNILATNTALVASRLTDMQGSQKSPKVLGTTKKQKNPAGIFFAVAGGIFATAAGIVTHIIKKKASA